MLVCGQRLQIISAKLTGSQLKSMRNLHNGTIGIV